MSSYEIFIAKRYLKSGRRSRFVSAITYISVGGVAVGVAALVIVLSLMNGFAGEVRTKLVGMDAHLRVIKFHGAEITRSQEIVSMLRGFPHVVGVSPSIYSEGLVMSKRGAAGVRIKGVDESTIDQVSDIRRNIIYGEMYVGNADDGTGSIVMGNMLADRLDVSVNDEVYVLSPASLDLSSAFLTPKMTKFIVTGIFETGMFDFDFSFVIMSIESARKVTGIDDGVSWIELKLDDLYLAKPLSKAVSDSLGYPYYALSWMDINRHLFNWMTLEKWASFIVLCLIVIVAAFNIASTLIMAVMEKTRDIGILKSMGATPGSIRKIFVFQGLAVGISGTIAGCVLGYIICWVQNNFKVISLPPDIYMISAVPMDMRAFDFLWISAAAICISLLASLYPASKAASLDPVQAIRYE